MNQFINMNKRSVELPKGCKDLADVLRYKKCEYCEDGAVATAGWPADYRWCDACQRALAEFASKEDYIAAYHLKDDAAISLYQADVQRRQDDFMHKRVKERNAHDPA